MKTKRESKDRHKHTRACTYVVQIGGKSISINHEVAVKRTLQQTCATFISLHIYSASDDDMDT